MFAHSRLLQAILAHSKSVPGKVAIVSGGRKVTYAGLLSGIRKAASRLSERGVKKGSVIVLSAQKDIDFVFVYFASHAVGAINVIVDASASSERLRFIEKSVRPDLCIGYVSSGFPSAAFAELAISAATEADVEPLGLSCEDDAEILFTTGTTGIPKGVRLSHFNIASSAENINAFIGNGADDREVLALPICHSFGLGRLRCNVLKGATIVLLGSFANVRQFFRALEEWHATGFGMVPAAWAYIRKMSGTRIAQFANQIRYIEIGSAAMPLSAKKELCSLFPNTRICHHYGLTEASRAAFMEYHAEYDHLETIGRPVCDQVEIRVLDGEGVECPVNVPGELCVKGNMVTRGYLSDAIGSKTFLNGYFRTGDEAYRDAEGRLYLVGRQKEMINVGGKKVSPVEVENAIVSLGVEDCAAVGIKDPEGLLGEVVKVYVQRFGTSLTLDEIRRGLIGKLQPHEIPAEFEWIDEIPKTASGKKQRLLLKK